MLDVQAEAPTVGPEEEFDCLIFGDVLEHLVDPEDVLRRYRPLLAPGGVVLVSLPNIQPPRRSEPAAGRLPAAVGAAGRHPSPLLHAHELCQADAGRRLPAHGPDQIRSGEADPFVEAAVPAAALRRPSARGHRAARHLPVHHRRQPAPRPAAGFAPDPITFVACVNDDDQLESEPAPARPALTRGRRTSCSCCAASGRPPTASTPPWNGPGTTWWSSSSRTSTCPAAGTTGSGTAGPGRADHGAGRGGRALRLPLRPRGQDLAGPGARPPVRPRHARPPAGRGRGLDEIVLAVRRDTPLRFDPSLGPPLRRRHLPGRPRAELAVAVLEAPLPAQLPVRLPLTAVPRGPRAAAGQVASGPAPVQQHGPPGRHGAAARPRHLGGGAHRTCRRGGRGAGRGAGPAGGPAAAHRQH